MRGEIIAIGDELTTGQRLDTNSQWLAARLTAAGVEVVYHSTVGDDLQANIAVFANAIARADVVVATGGLGPTADDLTRESLAAAAGVELERHDPSLQHIKRLFQARGREMPDRNTLQAMFPVGSTPVENEHGTAPGIEMAIPRQGQGPCAVFALPGVPAEMKPMWERSVLPAIRRLQPAPRTIVHRRLKCFGVGESAVEQMMPDLIARKREPLVGITVHKATITLRITASGPDEASCLAAMKPTEQEIRDTLGVLVFGEEDDELQHVVLRQLRRRGESVFACDAATGGVLAHWLAEADSGDGAFAGADVRPATPMSEDDASKLAASQRAVSNADYVVVVAPADGTQEVESIATAVAGPLGVRVKTFPNLGHPDIEHERAGKVVLNELRKLLQNTD